MTMSIPTKLRSRSLFKNLNWSYIKESLRKQEISEIFEKKLMVEKSVKIIILNENDLQYRILQQPN